MAAISSQRRERVLRSFFQQLEHRLDPLSLKVAQEAYASVAIVILKDLSGPGLLLIKRAFHPLDPWSGQMGLPGGKAEQGELPHETALRECHEELGLSLQGPLGQLQKVPAYGRGRFQDFHIHPHLFTHEQNWTELSDLMVLSPAEVESCFFVSFEDLLNPQMHSTFKSVDPRLKNHALPCFQFEEQLVWGLTYHILGEFFKKASGLSFETAKGQTNHISAEFWGKFPKI